MAIVLKNFSHYSCLSRRFGNNLIKLLSFETKPRLGLKRFYCDRVSDDDKSVDIKTNSKTNYSEPNKLGLESKYKIFQESDAPILLDVYEEKMDLQMQQNKIDGDEEIEEYCGLSMHRGVKGVFDIEDLIDLLRRDKAEDIFVAELPLEARYVDYIVIVSGRSRKHMTALAEIVRRVFKKKRESSDILPRIEGEKSFAWIALDLGNIALHIFSKEARETYDLESLWSVGPAYDPQVNKPEDQLTALLREHSISVQDLKSKGQLL